MQVLQSYTYGTIQLVNETCATCLGYLQKNVGATQTLEGLDQGSPNCSPRAACGT